MSRELTHRKQGIKISSGSSLKWVVVCFFSSMHEAIIPRGARQGQSQLKRTCSIFAYEDIKEVHKRRYLLQVSMHVSLTHTHTHCMQHYMLSFNIGTDKIIKLSSL